MTATLQSPEPAVLASVFTDPHSDVPLRAEAYGLERLEAYARDLAKACIATASAPSRRPLLQRVRENGRFLAEAHHQISAAARRQEPLTPDAEWLLDNYYVVEAVLREVKHDLPHGYYAELPSLVSGPLAGYPRVFALALGLIAHTDSGLEETAMLRFVLAYQTVAPLTIGELWAVPIMLRLGLIENLRRLAEQLLQTRADRECSQTWSRAQLAQPAGSPGQVVPPERLTDPCVVGLLHALRDQGAAASAIEWLEDWLARRGLTATDVLRREHQRQAANQVSIGNCVTSLRLLAALDWSEFFEHASLVELALRADPALAYARQDFFTRDRYRRAVEQLARGSGRDEQEVARHVLCKAGEAREPRQRHVGYHLVDEGRPPLEAELGYRPRWRDRPRAFLLRHAHGLYFGAILLVVVLALAGLVALAWSEWEWWALVLVAIGALPASEVAVGLVHFLVTRLLPPRALPKLDFKEGIPPDCATFVVVPGMLIRPESAAQLFERLELHYLANPTPALSFAILTDFADAEAEHRPEDEALVQAALDGVKALNARHCAGGPDRFFLLHRRRQWSPGENRWMGWERKRGKLIELNRLLRGDRTTSFAVCSAPPEQLPRVRFVLTLDADTRLPRDAARRLIGTLAHPLNQPRFDPTRRRVVSGYALLQPRVSFLFRTGLRSRFARTFAGSAGIDPYSAAVSDVYQDAFGAGSYTGKGLYDLDAFAAATEKAFPDNHVLSHDLIESNFARCGLVTDVEVFDDFPAKYHAFARREHRWARGDWQLLPWLAPRVPINEPPWRAPNPLPLLARWKVFDNLRRTLVPVGTLAMLLLGWTVLPGPAWAWAWTLLALVVPAVPLVLQFLGGWWDLLGGASLRGVARSWREGLPATTGQVLLTTVFLPDQARLMLHAIGVTLYRLFLSRRHLLEWETAAAAEQRLGGALRDFLLTMWPTSAFSAAAVALVAWARPEALPVALPLLALWLLSPLVAWWVSMPPSSREKPLAEDDRRALRRVARKTWSFFETFIGPEDNWLPPDNFQENPKGQLAHRTSPTNKGLLLLSTLAAHDLGYIGLPALRQRLAATFATLHRLERHQGHFLNWYDTRTLQPLHPAYVSTVDSGNLLGCLLALKQGLLEKGQEAFPPRSLHAGTIDVLGVVADELERLRAPGSSGSDAWRDGEEEIRQFGALLEAEVPQGLSAWDGWLAQAATRAEAIGAAVGRVEAGLGGAPTELGRWTKALAEQIKGRRAELEELAPWVVLLRDAAVPDGGERWQELRRSLDEAIQPNAWPEKREKLLTELASCQKAEGGVDGEGLPARLAEAVESAPVARLAGELQELAGDADRLAGAMDFRFLFNADRNLFSIGFNLPLARLDNAHYDLLASEACLASFLAVARGEVPRNHWFQLGRPATRVAGQEGLLSWGGTMFEYLMPRLVLPHYPGTVLDAAQRAAVARQMEYGRQSGVPWGVSESAFNVLDAAQDYQDQSFGVPGLGIKRGLGQDLVLAPYATALAAPLGPLAACRNLEALRAMGAEGPHGFYEAIDCTPSRLEKGETFHVVRSYMAHHQGMALVALTNSVLDNLMPRRLRGEPVVRAAVLLLQERIPLDAPLVQAGLGEEAPRQQLTLAHLPVSRRITTPHTASPRTHLLSNGQYTVLLTNAGDGFSTCQGLDVTRWRQDRDAGGHYYYVRDLQSGSYWSAGYLPARVTPDVYEVIYSADKAELRRVDGTLETHVEVTVSPEKNVEVRRFTLTNHEAEPRLLELTSYVEVALVAHSADLSHPAFHQLFLETEWVAARGALLCRRRPRAAEEKPSWAVHVVAVDGTAAGLPQFETDRDRFLGRRNTPAGPAALSAGALDLAGSVGPVLAPAFSLRQRVRLGPGAAAVIAFSTAVAHTREEALSLADEFHSQHAVTRAFELAWAHCHVQLRHLNLSPEEAHLFQRLAGHVLFPGLALRAAPSVLAANTQGQAGLWRQGISGDHPIVVVRVGAPQDVDLARQILAAHTYWRTKGLTVDLVLLNENPASYFEELHQQLQALVRASDAHALVDKPGGVFVRKASHLLEGDRTLLLAAARVVLEGNRGPLTAQLEVLEKRRTLPPALAPKVRPAPGTPSVASPAGLLFDNGIGGFSADGREYVVLPGAVPPAPWINVVANPSFGFLISDSGAGYTWADNSQQNRLTPWSNDPVSDPPGEALYLRDEETGEVWSPTPLPVANAAPTVVRHAPGHTTFEQKHAGLTQALCLFVAPDEPVKFLRLKVKNEGRRPRRLSATFFVEWVLGTTRDQTSMHVVTEMDPRVAGSETLPHDPGGALFARNAFNPDFGGAIAFLDVDHRPRTFTSDRTEFIGRNGSLAAPAALKRAELSGQVGPGLGGCGAVQARFDLAPGGETEVVFLLGQAPDREAARALAARFRAPGAAEAAFQTSAARWDGLLGTVQVRTPDPAMDLLLNRWLLTQVLACRVWGRSAFYQSGGAYGFRDQLQDVMALVYAAPGEARAQILRAAAHQFEEGDVQHWWHPPAGRGVRTRFSDDFLWLPFVVSHYVRTTGDRGVLDEIVPFLKAPLLAPDQEEVYGLPAVGPERGTVYEHCVRSLENGWKLGAHGLPLMGTGDWNDGMNRVGSGGKGESVWVGWFQLACLQQFAAFAEQRGDAPHGEEWQRRAEALRTAIEANAWDGAWYRRAYFDDGTPLGSASNDECQIDSLAQTWAVISGAGGPERARQGMAAVEKKLVRRADRIVLLFTPPFDHGSLHPGYIKGYVPGIRENGGQYTHAATWVVEALALLGQGGKAVDVFDMLSPVRHAATAERVALYRVEPYVVAADVYGEPPHTGRGGWTWYTGSASWLYRVGLEAILGFHKRGDRLRVDPRIPKGWKGFEITYRHRSATYRIVVENARGVESGVRGTWVDGELQAGGEVELKDDGGTHEVRVEMGPPSKG